MTPTLSAPEVCAHFKISARTLRRYLRANPRIRPLLSGRRLLFTAAEIEQLEEYLRTRYSAYRSAAAKRPKGRSADAAWRAQQRRRTSRRLADTLRDGPGRKPQRS